MAQESRSAPKCLMGKMTKNLFLDMKKWVREEVKSRIGTSKIDPLMLGAFLLLEFKKQNWPYFCTLGPLNP